MAWDPRPWRAVFAERDHSRLIAHLFPGDQDEHGAVLAAGLMQTDRETRLLIREVFPAIDGVDFVPGIRGYRRLTPEFVNRYIRYCRDEKLVYLAVHNHGGRDEVAFSTPDMASHERGYPALLDIARGMPVGALVLNENSVAGDIWTPDDSRREIRECVILGRNYQRLYPNRSQQPPARQEMDDRQARIYGDAGQALFSALKVGVIGAGGVGMPIVAHLARLGVGQLVVVDPDEIELSNLPRLPETTSRDAGMPTPGRRVSWLQRVRHRRLRPRAKVEVAKRIARNARPDVILEAIHADVTTAAAAARLVDCDYLFLAANTHQARAVFNALVHQYLIPGVQVGSLVEVDRDTGMVGKIFSVVRPVSPDGGCLQCNGLINPARLQEEALDRATREAQQYGFRDDAPAPSVMSLNSIGVARAVNDFMLAMTGLRLPSDADGRYIRFETRAAKLTLEEPRADADCLDCSQVKMSGRARGDYGHLPVRAN